METSRCLFKSFDRVVSAGMQGMTAKQAHQPHKKPFQGAVTSERHDRIIGTGRVKPAAGIE